MALATPALHQLSHPSARAGPRFHAPALDADLLPASATVFAEFESRTSPAQNGSGLPAPPPAQPADLSSPELLECPEPYIRGPRDLPHSPRIVTPPGDHLQLLCLSETEVSTLALLAIEGTPAAIQTLASGCVCTPSIRPKALHRLLEPACAAGVSRLQLQEFIRHVTARTHHAAGPAESNLDPISNSFVRAVDDLLRVHVVLLQSVGKTVAVRRKAEAPPEAPYGDGSLGDHVQQPSLPEVLTHTAKLRAQVAELARICGCCAVLRSRAVGGSGTVHAPPAQPSHDALHWQVVGFPVGIALLSYLYDELEQADAETLHVCQFLFSSALSPYAADLMLWVYSPSQPTAAFFAARPDSSAAEKPVSHVQWCPPPDRSGPLGASANRPGTSPLRAADGAAFDPLSLDSTCAHLPTYFPSFLRDMGHLVRVTGQQLRLLAHLAPHTAELVALLERSAERQVAEVRVCGEQARGAMALLGSASAGELLQRWRALSTDVGAWQKWGFHLAWRMHLLSQVHAVISEGSAERKALVAAMLRHRAEARAATAEAEAAEALRARQTRERAAAALETQRLEALHQQRLRQAELLCAQRLELDSRQAQAAAEDARRIREEQEALHCEALREHAAITSKLAAEVLDALAADADLQRREARAAWRLSRWNLAAQRRQRLGEIAASEAQELMMDEAEAAAPVAGAPSVVDSEECASLMSSVRAPSRSSQASSRGVFRRRAGAAAAPVRSLRGDGAAAFHLHALPPVLEDGDDVSSHAVGSPPRFEFDRHDGRSEAPPRSTRPLSSYAASTSRLSASRRSFGTVVGPPPSEAAAHGDRPHLPRSSRWRTSAASDLASDLASGWAAASVRARSETVAPSVATADSRHILRGDPTAVHELLHGTLCDGSPMWPLPPSSVASAPLRRVDSPQTIRSAALARGRRSHWGELAAGSALQLDGAAVAETGSLWESSSRASVAPHHLRSSAAGGEPLDVAQSLASAPLSRFVESTARTSVSRASTAAASTVFPHSYATRSEPASAPSVAPSSVKSDRRALHKAWHVAPDTSLAAAGGAPRGQSADGSAAQRDAYVPALSVVQRCVLAPVEEQYRLVSAACLALFRDELQLLDMCQALRNVFMGGLGDFLLHVTEGVVAGVSKTRSLAVHELNACLQHAFAASALPDTSSVASQCRFVLRPGRRVAASRREAADSSPSSSPTPQSPGDASSPSDGPGARASYPDPGRGAASAGASAGACVLSVAADPGDITALDAAQLTYHVAWPLSIVITERSLHHYADVFTLLVRCRWVASRLQTVLKRLFRTLRARRDDPLGPTATGREASGAAGEPGPAKPSTRGPHALSANPATRARRLITTLKAVAHVVASVQQHMHTDVLGVEWAAFERSVAHDARDLVHLRLLHDSFAERCAQRCMPSLDAHLSSLVAGLWQAAMRIASRVEALMDEPDSSGPHFESGGAALAWLGDDVRWGGVASKCDDIDARVKFLHKRLKFRAWRGAMQGWLVQLSFNSYFAE